jgi:hypothetical protein
MTDATNYMTVEAFIEKKLKAAAGALHQADALAEQAQALADRLSKLEDRPRPEPLPATLDELLKRRANGGDPAC